MAQRCAGPGTSLEISALFTPTAAGAVAVAAAEAARAIAAAPTITATARTVLAPPATVAAGAVASITKKNFCEEGPTLRSVVTHLVHPRKRAMLTRSPSALGARWPFLGTWRAAAALRALTTAAAPTAALALAPRHVCSLAPQCGKRVRSGVGCSRRPPARAPYGQANLATLLETPSPKPQKGQNRTTRENKKQKPHERNVPRNRCRLKTPKSEI